MFHRVFSRSLSSRKEAFCGKIHFVLVKNDLIRSRKSGTFKRRCSLKISGKEYLQLFSYSKMLFTPMSAPYLTTFSEVNYALEDR